MGLAQSVKTCTSVAWKNFLSQMVLLLLTCITLLAKASVKLVFWLLWNQKAIKTNSTHFAATNPLALDRDSVDASDIERERTVLIEQAKEAGKPEEIAIKMVEGRMHKFYEENCLLEQAFVIDPDNSVAKAVDALAKEIGSPIKVTGYVRFELGAGIEKKEE